MFEILPLKESYFLLLFFLYMNFGKISGHDDAEILLKQEIIKVRESIPCIGPLTKVIPLNLFLDIAPRSWTDFSRVAWMFS